MYSCKSTQDRWESVFSRYTFLKYILNVAEYHHPGFILILSKCAFYVKFALIKVHFWKIFMTSHCCQNLSARKKKSRKEKEERKKETEEKNSRKIENGLHLKWLQHITPETIIIFIIVYCPRLHTHTAYCLESCFITMDTVQIDRPFVYKIYYLQLSSKNSSCIPTACPCSHALTC